jgi:hypothetical protein
LLEAQTRIRELEQQLEDNGVTDEEMLQRRLSEEMAHERDQYRAALADRDFALEQTRTKYQGEFQLMSDGTSPVSYNIRSPLTPVITSSMQNSRLNAPS